MYYYLHSIKHAMQIFITKHLLYTYNVPGSGDVTVNRGNRIYTWERRQGEGTESDSSGLKRQTSFSPHQYIIIGKH